MTEEVAQIEQLIRQRMDQLAGLDPQCCRWIGQLDILKRPANDPATDEDGAVPDTEEADDDT